MAHSRNMGTHVHSHWCVHTRIYVCICAPFTAKLSHVCVHFPQKQAFIVVYTTRVFITLLTPNGGLQIEKKTHLSQTIQHYSFLKIMKTAWKFPCLKFMTVPKASLYIHAQ